MWLQIGDVDYKVEPGLDCAFAQQVLAVDIEAESCHYLGPISDRLVCSVDVDSLLP